MNKLLLIISFTFFSLAAFSQKVYFIYLQSESEQPFFVKIKDKVHSSSASGYLILSKLHDSTYEFKIGFPQNKWQEQAFSVSVNKKDHGFLLKNFGEKGWGLFDLFSLSVIQANPVSAQTDKSAIIEKKDVSEFTELLSKAADDPAIKEKTVQLKPLEKKSELVVQDVIINKESTRLISDSSQIKTETKIAEPVISEIAIAEIKQPVNNKIDSIPVLEIDYKRSIVSKRSESSTTEGFGLVFLDEIANGIKDTIRLLIPNPQSIVSAVAETPKQEKKFLEITNESNNKSEEANRIQSNQKVKDSLVTITQKLEYVRCPNLADENDFFKLRKLMAAIDGDEEMIYEAKKYFKQKCFTTLQIKNLSTLFLNDEAKYHFFDVAYLFAVDKENYASLQTEIKEDYFINRFKAMIRN